MATISPLNFWLSMAKVGDAVTIAADTVNDRGLYVQAKRRGRRIKVTRGTLVDADGEARRVYTVTILGDTC